MALRAYGKQHLHLRQVQVSPRTWRWLFAWSREIASQWHDSNDI